jgi:hypothetical protein
MTETGTKRNQPSNTRLIFGPSVWLRGLIKPPPDHSLAYTDWAGLEFTADERAQILSYCKDDVKPTTT